MRRKKKLFWVILIIAIIVIAIPIANFLINYQNEPRGMITNRTFFSYSDLFFKYEITRYPSSVEIVPVESSQQKILVGLSADPWNLNFGIIPVGKNFGKRFINLVNLKEKDAKIVLKVDGNISKFVKFSKNNFILHPNENVTIEVTFYAEGASVGNYTGVISVIVQRPKYDFIYIFWR
jgi:hypothetical protein